MNKLFKMLPVVALVLGIGAAIAGSMPANTKQAYISNQWVDITGQIQGQDYACDNAPTQNCTRELTPSGQVVSLVHGSFRDL